MSKELTFIDAIFIGGTGRSGTTILGKLLGRHHQIQLAKPVEIKFLTAGTGLLDLNRNALISRAGKITLLRNGNFLKFQKSVNQKWWERDGKKGGKVGLSSGISRSSWEVLESELGKNLRIDRTMACQSFFRSFLDLQLFNVSAPNSKRFWVDTTPPNLMRADEIAKLLPDCKFIHIMRDGRDVASSVIKERWGPDSFDDALIWWSKRMKTILQNTQELNDQVLHIWFEDLVHFNRDVTLRKILDFLEVSEDDGIRKYFDEIVIPASANSGRWRNEVLDKERYARRYEGLIKKLVERGLLEPMTQI
jgi:hypothetical protein